jgi:hypothetical protein
VRRLDAAFARAGSTACLEKATRRAASSKAASSRRTPKAEAGLSTGLDRTKEAMN